MDFAKTDRKGSGNYDLVGAEDSKLNHSDFGDLCRRVGESNVHCGGKMQGARVSEEWFLINFDIEVVVVLLVSV